jgi:hypothetical protein
MHLLTMDPNFGGKIFLIQMFVSIILMSSIMIYKYALWCILATRKKIKNGSGGKNLNNPHIRFKWKQNIWHTT